MKSFLDPADVPRDAIQILRPDGGLVADHGFELDLDAADLLELYGAMVEARAVDTEAVNLQRQGALGVYSSSLGQEAAQVGVGYALRPEDWVFPSYRELPLAMLRGIEPAALMHQFRGTSHAGLFDIRKHRFAPYTIPIATQLPHAVGFAHGARLDGQDMVVLACFGDGATSEGDFHEACNFAGVWKAPVVFFCQNNQYAISVPVHQQTAAPTLHVRALGYGMPGWRVDGNDVLASYVVGREAVAHARAGKGPAFIEALTYRLGGHSTADDASRYRSDSEVARWQGLDPIARLETYLRAVGILTTDLASQVEAKSRQLQAEVRAAIFDAATPDPAIMFDHVYSGRGPGLEKQRADCIAEGEQG